MERPTKERLIEIADDMLRAFIANELYERMRDNPADYTKEETEAFSNALVDFHVYNVLPTDEVRP